MTAIDGYVKKNILCYGDGNTWGWIPGSNGERFPSHVRWPGVLSKLLRADIRVVEEGLCGRTAISDNPVENAGAVEKNGFKTFGAYLDTHSPLDLVVIMLGTNDLRHASKLTAHDIAGGVMALAEMARSPIFGPDFATSPEVLIVCPPSIWEVEAAWGLRFLGGRETSLDLREAFRQMSKQYKLPVIFVDDFVHSDPSDGVHLSADSHAVLGQEIARWILDR